METNASMYMYIYEDYCCQSVPSFSVCVCRHMRLIWTWIIMLVCRPSCRYYWAVLLKRRGLVTSDSIVWADLKRSIVKGHRSGHNWNFPSDVTCVNSHGDSVLLSVAYWWQCVCVWQLLIAACRGSWRMVGVLNEAGTSTVMEVATSETFDEALLASKGVHNRWKADSLATSGVTGSKSKRVPTAAAASGKPPPFSPPVFQCPHSLDRWPIYCVRRACSVLTSVCVLY